MCKCSKFLIVFIVLVLGVEGYVYYSSQSLATTAPPAAVSATTTAADMEASSRMAVETQYPQFSNFENQKSFAGQKVNFAKDDSGGHLAYMVLGSGLPVIKATCFSVDSQGQVLPLGEFPDPKDSYRGYSDVDPRNCRGIK